MHCGVVQCTCSAYTCNWFSFLGFGASLVTRSTKRASTMVKLYPLSGIEAVVVVAAELAQSRAVSTEYNHRKLPRVAKRRILPDMKASKMD
ncbi:hypothetical protein ACFX13_010225 [Malus domestica]